MRIKEVRINGFRSYKDNTNVSGFSPRSNVVVGRNGSGKSNFFHAIQFVLSEEYSHLKEEERLGILHESTGPKVAHARVEIIFDNSDKRLLAFENPEVKIVRQVGKKKDNYYIDTKMVTRSEVVNLMESAGFSRSNPYYIVKQGKINELATSSDASKLKLLKEVAGTRVYDERKEESLKILKETKMKTEKIEGLLKYIDERLQTLENEKEDLKEYQKLDKTKRSIEYTMYDNTNKEATKEKSKLDEQKIQLRAKDNDVKQQLQDISSEMAKLDVDKKKMDVAFRQLKEDRDSLLEEKSKMNEEQCKLKLEIESLNEESTKERQGRQSAENSLQNITEEIAKNESDLQEIKPEYANLVEEESRLTTDIRIDEAQIKEILAKQGQRTQFSSMEERDGFLRKEVRRVTGMIADSKEQEELIAKELENLEADNERVSGEIQQISLEIENNRLEMDNHGGNTSRLKQEFDDAYNALQSANREEKTIRDEMANIDQDIAAAHEQLRRLIPRGVYNGMTGVKKVMDAFRAENRDGRHDDVINGYFGTVIEAMEVDSIFCTAVEVILTNRIFYHVVSNDQISTKILRKFNEMQLPGEVNIYPLNRTNVPPLKKLQNSSNCRLMFEIIDFDCKFEKVIKSMCANVVIVRALDESSRALRNEGFDVVSTDGDQISRKGVMSGGFIDRRKNKLELHMQKKKLQDQRDELVVKLEKAEHKVKEMTKAAEQVRSRMAQNENQIGEYHRKHRGLTEQKQALSQQFFMAAKMKEPMRAQLIEYRNRLRELNAQKENLEKEIGSNMSSQLTSDEEQTVKDLRKHVDDMKKQLADVSRRRMDLMHRKNAIENLLTKKLYKTKENLSARVDDISDNERSHKLETCNAQYSSLLSRIQAVTSQLNSVNAEIADLEAKSTALTINIDSVTERLRDQETLQRDYQKQHDVIALKEDEVKQRREDALKKMRQLGALPTDVFSKWQNVKQRDLEKKLLECVNDLKKYDNVNKKALDQYMTASTQKQELTARMVEQKKSEDSIEELLKVLENRKNEAIELTFKQVKHNFEHVFKQLVPHGSGKMDMIVRDREAGEERLHIVELYKGITVMVSFVSNSGESETREMNQLSGGQKSLVALAIIFAIQKCDPAPFYLFDEIDAALDAQHRKAVADMIRQLSDQAQFVTTTFRPELLATAERFFGVRFRNKVSHIDSVTREQAYDFVEDDTTHG